MKLFLSLSAALALPFALRAADSKGTYTKAADAGPDFVTQGEYIGEDSAAQVIALGDGKFHVVGFEGGLPGAEKSSKHIEVDAKRDGDKVVFDQNGWKGEITGDKLIATNPQNEKFTLTKT